MPHPIFCGHTPLDIQNPSSYTPTAKKEVLINSIASPSAAPDKELLKILQALSLDERNRVVVISGRDRLSMEQWLGRLSLYLVAEHGAWLREPSGDWRTCWRPLPRIFT
ncbi:MAG: hypothetical protein KJ814_05730 [Proteobacteria bacterium]|nr:hypothetical protein [Pseudomonadota bacterium]